MKRVKLIGGYLTRIVDTGPRQPLIDPAVVAEALGATIMRFDEPLPQIVKVVGRKP